MGDWEDLTAIHRNHCTTMAALESPQCGQTADVQQRAEQILPLMMGL